MAVRQIFVSDIDGKTEIAEDDVVTIRITDGGGDVHSLDMTDAEFEKHFGKFLTEQTNITRTAANEFDAKLQRAVRAKVEAGELLEVPSGRSGATRRQSVNTSSGKSSEELAAIRSWAKGNGYEVSDRGRIKAEIVKAYEDAKGGSPNS